MLLGIDQGTTGTTCLVLDESLRTRGRGYREVAQRYPRPGWVEQDPNELWESVLGAANDALEAAGIGANDLGALGITLFRRAAREQNLGGIAWLEGIVASFRHRGAAPAGVGARA